MACKTISKFIFAWNNVGPAIAAQAASTVLEKNRVIKDLDLRCCGIDTRSSCLIAAGLERACQLSILRLDGNSLGKLGARFLVRAASVARQAGKEIARNGEDLSIGVEVSMESCNVDVRSAG